MRQVVQAVGGGRLRLVDVPRPTPSPTEVLVAPTRSLLSPGTERAVRSLAQEGLLGKARARPDLVRQVVAKARTDGLAATVRTVRDRLEDEQPLGYSSAGVVVEVGAAVTGLRVGQRVAAAGAGHAELQVVAGLLAVPLPDEVSDEQAAFGALGAIALNAVRAADVQPGSLVAVVGLGLLGRLVARVVVAAGASVAGLDVRDEALVGPDPLSLAVRAGDEAAEQVRTWAHGRGVDSVIVAAADPSGDAVASAPAMLRDRGRIVVVGDAALAATRRAMYEGEHELVVVRSYGPGRYDPSYESLGVDHPVGHVRWTAGRNLEAFVALVAAGQLEVDDLVGHRVPFGDVERAYEVLESDRRPLAVELVYDTAPEAARPLRPSTSSPARPAGAPTDALRVGIVGAGRVVRSTLLPAMAVAGWPAPVAISSAGGRSAAVLAERVGQGCEARTVDEVVHADDVDLVLVATTHDALAGVTVAALEAGKHVCCEKPLAIDESQLATVEAAWRASGRSLFVDLNRRHSAAVSLARGHLDAAAPRVITYRVSTGRLAEDHWYHDRRQGGRLIGEGCHWIDTATALAGSPVVRVSALGSPRPGEEALLVADLVLALQHQDGSTSAITVASGGAPGETKERIEVRGGGRTAVVDDFREVLLDGRRRRLPKVDRKGHAALLAAVGRAIAEGDTGPTEDALASIAATLASARALLEGEVVPVAAAGGG